jgi:hypothetical protein
MQQLPGDIQLEPSIMKQFFLQRLPSNAQLILASTADEIDTTSLAKMADKIVEVAPVHSTISTVVPQSAPPPTAQSTEINAWTSRPCCSADHHHQQFQPPHFTERRSSRSPTRRSSSPFHDRERTTTEPSPPLPEIWDKMATDMRTLIKYGDQILL